MNDVAEVTNLEWQLLAVEWQLGTSLSQRLAGFTPAEALDQLARGAVRMRAATREKVGEALAGMQQVRSDVIMRSDPGLPEGLRQLADPPFGLMLRGNRALLERSVPRVAIIGSRRPRESASIAAEAIARGLARRGITVVSGLAIGIDGRAHEAALDAGGTTIAVLGSGIDNVHPRSNRRLADRIVRRDSLLVSEYAPTAGAHPWMFRARNRLLAALSDYVVVVQARRASGSMITVRCAQDLGIDVGVVPSAIDDPAFDGSIELLREGARAIVDAESVARALGLEAETSSQLHQFGSTLDVPRSITEIVATFDLEYDDVVCDLLDLELEGLIVRTPDGRYRNVQA
ncbi:MAG: DNA-protecting protein DprA [Thermoleophilia bacterium]|nr:DNA-protecting protein DprA [Thermoleophilia bacterium]